jgi:hypothetical protein
MNKIICRDVMQLDASPEQVHQFITDPQRIADYFPDLIDYGTFEAGKAIWCSGKSGVTLLELNEKESSDSKLVLTVVTSNTLKPPYTVERIKAEPFLSMVEDWELVAAGGGTALTKTWRNVVKHRMKWLPIGFIIRRTAKSEHAKLVNAWNRAAQPSK